MVSLLSYVSSKMSNHYVKLNKCIHDLYVKICVRFLPFVHLKSGCSYHSLLHMRSYIFCTLHFSELISERKLTSEFAASHDSLVDLVSSRMAL